MKGVTSYLGPLFTITIIIITDYSMFTCYITPGLGKISDGQWIFVILYQFPVLMSLISLFLTMYADPGYVPKQYEYKIDNLTDICKAILKHIIMFQNEDIDKDEKQLRLQPNYEFTLPLIRGDKTLFTAEAAFEFK